MSVATHKTEREYIFMPFGTYRGVAFPKIPRDFLERVVTEWVKDRTEKEHPGLTQSIAEYLDGKGYYFNNETPHEPHWQYTQSGYTTASSSRTAENWQWENFRESFRQSQSSDRQQRQQANNTEWFREGYQQSQYRPPQKAKIVADRAKAKEIIDAGRRRLAQKHHPDNGGDVEEMKAYNAVADWLETLL